MALMTAEGSANIGDRPARLNPAHQVSVVSATNAAGRTTALMRVDCWADPRDTVVGQVLAITRERVRRHGTDVTGNVPFSPEDDAAFGQALGVVE
jgi:hypothetical protein